MRRTDDDAGASSSRQSSSKSFFNVVSLSKVEHTREFLRRVGALNNAETKVDVDNGVVLYLQFFFVSFVFLDDFFRAFVSSATNFLEEE